MKSARNLTIFTLCLLTGIFSETFAQHYLNIQESVHYTMINTSADAMGRADNLSIVNAPFAGLEGILIKGSENAEAKEISQFKTGVMEPLRMPEYGVFIEFKLQSLDDQIHPIIMQGADHCVFGVGYKYDESKERADICYHINGQFIKSDYDFGLRQDEWHNIFYYHVKANAMTYVFLDRILIDSVAGIIEGASYDNVLTNVDAHTNATFEGYLRQLIIYEQVHATTAIDPEFAPVQLEAYPNPVVSELHIKTDYSYSSTLECFSANGSRYFMKSIPAGKTETLIASLPSGINVIKTGNVQEGYTTKMIVKN